MKENLMRGKRILFGIMIAVALSLMVRPSISIAATYDGAWLPNDSDFFAIELTPSSANVPGVFYMYDWGDTNTDLYLFTDDNFSSTTVYFTIDFGTWYASLAADTQTLNLGSTKEFGFYFLDGDEIRTSYILATVDPGKVYGLYEESTEMIVGVSGAAPVPIPASVLLLGSGVLGLIAIGRVRRDS